MTKILSDRIAVYLLIGGLLFRIIIALGLYPGYDEAYYYVYSHNLDWSYFDHPPIVAISTGFGTWITGLVNQFTIRFGTLLFYTGSLCLLYLTALKLFSLPVARMTLAIATLIPIYGIVFGILSQPDSPLIFFWSLTVYLAAQEFWPIREKNYHPSYRLAYIGLAVGLAVLSKYHGFILGFGLVLFCLTTPRYWPVFRSPWLGLGFILFLITLLPIIYWNINHDWISFRFHLEDRFSGEPKTFNILGILSVIGISIATMFPPFGLPMWWVTFKSFAEQIPNFLSKKRFFQRDEESLKKWLILSVSLPLILGMLYVGASHYLAPSWILPGFWSCTILLGEKANTWQQSSRIWVKRWLWGSGIFIVTVLSIAMLHVTFGTFQKPSQYAIFGGIIAPEQDPSREIVDIDQLRQGFANSPELLALLKDSSFVFTHSFYVTAWLDMAIYPLVPIPVTCFNNDQRGYQIWFNPQEWIGKNGLLITTNSSLERPEIIDRYRPYFQDITKVAVIPIKRGGVAIEQFHVYQAKGLIKTYP
ncbi:MAG: glycosyltransferase family 39 protein [Microcystis sp. M20BS1]|uniref:ArnT family glycosyltransferase n=1 Tax=Microcystis TaxID=1125 RepID=UPI000F446C37|nr:MULTISPECIES: glycosyltransferase family 39 protein [Microcystis]MCA2624391.1 glycosyltransferase family 39 protein [Microcystis sp. M19BS1]MCA2634305.1 glycosyltransferase family 39 protein [Microcystis sp. M20BS1]ROH94525.1 phospholipid carrier-dependent glycosyltransferase [Microcystis aeruginosa FACHB-524]